MTAKPNENRTGKLDNSKDYVVAFRRLVDDFNKLVRAFNAGTTESISFSEIEEKPDTLEGYGITDAAKKKHKHAVSDIVGLGVGGGTPGADGDKGDKGDPGERGLRGLSVLGLDGRSPEEPVMIPGRRGIQGIPGAPGAGGGGAASHEGVLSFGNDDYKEPPFTVGVPGRDGAEGGFVPNGTWDAGSMYFETDVVYWHGALWFTKFGEVAGDEPGVAGGWLVLLPTQRGPAGPPSLEVLPPLEPMMIPGRRGATGAAGAGGGGGGNTLYAPGSFTVATDNFAFHSRRLILTGAQRATLEGTATLRIT